MIKNAVFDGIRERTMFRQKNDKKKRPTGTFSRSLVKI